MTAKRLIASLVNLSLYLLVWTSSCPNVKFKLRSNVISQRGVLCSKQSEDISTPDKVGSLLGRDYIIGIYKRNNFIGQPCYWKEIENGLVFLSNLTGGTFYAIGKLIKFSSKK